jgi:fructokinase
MIDPAIFREAELCVVGGICRDVKTAPLVPGEHLFADGETPVGGIQETIGGGAANSAGIAASLGARARFAGVVGDDPLGRQLEQALERAGVRCFLRHVPGLTTGTTVNLVYTTGQRHFLSCHPNNAAFSLEHIDLAALAGAAHLLRGDVWFSEPMLYGGNEQLFREARRRGLRISIDLNWDPRWGHAPPEDIRRRKEAIRHVLPWVDVAHGNVRELSALADAVSLEQALEKLAGWGAGAVVVHLGAQGAGYYAGKRWTTVLPAPVTQRVVATGTGDVLSVCMMLLDHRTDLDPADKLRLANTVVAEFMEGRRKLIPAL